MENEKFIVRDSDQTKYYLWDAYEGYYEHFGNYIMYEQIGSIPLDIKAGLHKYITKFYYQTYKKWDDFEEIKTEKKNKYKFLMKKTELEKEDYQYIMEFIEEFMHYTGVKNIVFKKDNPGESVKKNR